MVPDSNKKSRKPWLNKAMGMAKVWRLLKSSQSICQCFGLENKARLNLRRSASASSAKSSSSATALQSSPVLIRVTSPRNQYAYAPSAGSFFGLHYYTPAKTKYKSRGQHQNTGFRDQKRAARELAASAVHPVPASLPPRRKVFRGKSVMNNSLLRRTAMEEEAMLFRKLEQEVAVNLRHSKSSSPRPRQIGPSPLRHVVSASSCSCTPSP